MTQHARVAVLAGATLLVSAAVRCGCVGPWWGLAALAGVAAACWADELAASLLAAGAGGLPRPHAALALARARRSIYAKQFKAGAAPPSRAALEQLLEAARWAPTHKLTEPWRFVVLGGRAKAAFEELTIQACAELLPPDKAAATTEKLKRKQANDWPKVHCYIAICMTRHPEVPEWEEVAAVAAAVQNLWLQATTTAGGIGGYWSSWQAAARDSPAMAQLLGLDSAAGDRCLGVFVVGSPDEERVAALRPKRAPLEAKVEWRLDG